MWMPAWGQDRYPALQDAGAKTARGSIDLGLGQIQGVGALDVTTADVVGHHQAHHFHGGIDHQSQLRFGHGPGGITSNTHLTQWANDPASAGLEEYLRALRRVDAGVDITAIDGLLLPGLAAALVGHARRPHVLGINGRQPVRLAGDTGLPLIGRRVEQRDREDDRRRTGGVLKLGDGLLDAARRVTQPIGYRCHRAGDVMNGVVDEHTHTHSEFGMEEPYKPG